ncbi:MAG: TIGR04100 family radical SAM protein [Peptostreptococcaceae bacterium]
MNILYTIENSLYVNITNQCPCKCVFCIRLESNEVGESGSLWLDHEPTIEEVKDAFKNYDLNDFEEIVFCGYGEPLVRISEVVEISKYIKSLSDIKIRVNTNGLSDLIHEKETAIMLKDVIDSVSISLNAPDKEVYNKVTKPKFGEKSFDYMLKFAKDCKNYVNDVALSVVDEISEAEIEQSKALANELQIPLRVRHKS